MTQVDILERAKNFLHREGAKSFSDISTLMDRTAADWMQALEGMTEPQATHRPQPSGGIQSPAMGEGPKWCVKEVIGHWLLTERSLNNTVAGFAGVEPPPDPPEPVRAMGAQSPEYESLPLEALRAKLADFLQETLALIGRLESSSKLEATFPHPVFGPLNLKEWMAFHRLHALDHIQQIERIKTDPGYPRA